ncbi:MAG: radical SAM protein [Desulfoarculaceae bacterium]|nr:radical SAM protein [Desulfoarculaceae bacterium]
MPLVIPIFIPHQGCPQQCLFCNQHSITGEEGSRVDVAASVTATIREWLARPRRQKPAPGMDAPVPREPGMAEGWPSVQVAFFGGSFTCLPEARQQELLAAVQPFLRSGQVDCIRLSTRPDCVDKAVCSFLLSQGVRIVELGVQSLDDRVLRASWRGHDADDSRRAVALLRNAGMEVGIQLMPGLPLETTGSFLRTVREVIVLAPAFVRLYPVLVVEQAGLAAMYRRGDYRPLSMNKAIALTARAREMLAAATIRVVRIGLQPSAALERELLAGPYHPAFGELVASRIWFKRIRALLAACPKGRRLTVRISPRDLSAVIGMKRLNMKRFERLGMADRLELITNATMKRGTLVYAVN